MEYLLRWSGRRLMAAVLVLGVFTTGAQAAGEAQKPVLLFQDALLHVMRQGQVLGFEGRRHYLAPVVDQAFDLPRITRAIIGRYWDQLSSGDRQHLAGQIRAYALATLASRFDAYAGQAFTMGTQTPAGAFALRIKSHFSGPDTDVALDYLVRRNAQGSWRISNVWFDGVSGTDIQQKEFASFLRKGGAARLMAKLDEIITNLGREG